MRYSQYIVLVVRHRAESDLILVINCGSSSLKYEVYAMPERTSVGRGQVERIGAGGVILQESVSGQYRRERPVPDHEAAVRAMVEALVDEKDGFVDSLEAITGVGHRVVHGGERYAQSVIIDDSVLQAIEENIELAPLHNPANLTGIREAMRALPGVPQVAVFDTAFHQTLTPAAYLYGLPRELYEKHRIRRYGFHGTSHRYVANEAVRFMKRSPENTNVISCHLGNGASITAIRNGVSVDTSMGFTPLEGLMMGTRSGDIDPAIIFYLLERGYTAGQLNDMLNRQSGLLGLSGVSNDLRDLEEAAERGDRNALDALEVYAYRIRKYIGGYAANLVKVDILVFTGGIGQHGTRMRERICNRLENIGIVMDYRKNLENGPRRGLISRDYSPVDIVVIPTNEELQIAIDSHRLVKPAQ
ncbi:MAG: acetate kinase [Spirochaetaceae bacterium]|nr:MAG: acetate kinase [Spirochaetaceae bacterium]